MVVLPQTLPDEREQELERAAPDSAQAQLDVLHAAKPVPSSTDPEEEEQGEQGEGEDDSKVGKHQ